MASTNKILNDYLNNKRVAKENFEDLKIVVEEVGYKKKILDWFRFLQTNEIPGWRPKLVTEKIARLLLHSTPKNPIEFYALFCPSYKKGADAHGFRTDDVGNTSKWGIKTLQKITQKTKESGFPCKKSHAIFFDLALEQPEKTIKELDDLEKNISNLEKYLPEEMSFSLLSEIFPFLLDIIGRKGITIDPLPIPQVTLDRIIERGAKFYQLFDWTEKQIKERSKIIASSEALVGNTIRYFMPNSIMVYTPTMLERAQVYSGHKFETDPSPIIFPQKK